MSRLRFPKSGGWIPSSAHSRIIMKRIWGTRRTPTTRSVTVRSKKTRCHHRQQMHRAKRSILLTMRSQVRPANECNIGTCLLEPSASMSNSRTSNWPSKVRHMIQSRRKTQVKSRQKYAQAASAEVAWIGAMSQICVAVWKAGLRSTRLRLKLTISMKSITVSPRLSLCPR